MLYFPTHQPQTAQFYNPLLIMSNAKLHIHLGIPPFAIARHVPLLCHCEAHPPPLSLRGVLATKQSHCIYLFSVIVFTKPMTAKAIEWLDNELRILDQSKLPHRQIFIDLSDYQDVVSAIKTMQIRGAPAIGVAAAYGIALGAQKIEAENKDRFFDEFGKILEAFATSRPTAANLFRAIDRMKKAARGNDVFEIKRMSGFG